MVVGFAALMYRRIRFPRVRVTTTRMDVVTFVVLGLAIATGMLATLINIPDTVHYRESVAPYFRQIFVLNPEPSLMEGVNWVFQTHVIVVWLLYALWPFSRLIHAFTVPVGYLWRSRTGRAGLLTQHSPVQIDRKCGDPVKTGQPL